MRSGVASMTSESFYHSVQTRYPDDTANRRIGYCHDRFMPIKTSEAEQRITVQSVQCDEVGMQPIVQLDRINNGCQHLLLPLNNSSANLAS